MASSSASFSPLCPYHYYRAVDVFVRARPFTALVVSNSLTLLFVWIKHARARGGVKKVLMDLLLGAVKKIPGAAGAVEKEQQAVIRKMEKSIIGDRERWGMRHLSLPAEGVSATSLISKLSEWSQKETETWKKGLVSGAVYHGGSELTSLIVDTFRLFALTNPLHADLFPTVRKMDAEVVSMVCNLFGGGESCGAMTSGGTESILMAVLAARDWALETKGITCPEMIVPISAHAAFNKAAHYFGIKFVECKIDPNTFRADVADMRRKINRNTIMLVGSAPTFPHGMIDGIEEMGQLAKKNNLWLHVDCCLGSFVIAFARAAGFPTPPFDFTVEGVTSISCDTHKYGFAPKGSSVIMYRSKEFRHYQFFMAPKWTGGIYATPGMQGSRPGALSAACWAVLSHIGRDGYTETARRILTVAKGIESGLRQMKDLRVLGSPDLMVVSFTTADKNLSVHAIGDAMAAKGWHLNTLQNPAAIHIAVTLMHCSRDMPAKLLQDLAAAVEEVKTKGPEAFKDGFGAIYGLAESVPLQLVESLTESFLDVLYSA